MVERFRPDVEAFGDPDLLAAVDRDLAIIRHYASVRDLDDLENRIVQKGKFQNLEKACEKKLGVQTGGFWWGYVGTADSTLASDGQRIYGVFDQGQVFCLDLDGQIRWLQREKGRHDNRGTFHRSPLLCGDLLLVRNMGQAKGSRTVRALDTRTGQARWEAPLAGSNYAIPRLMRLAAPDGDAVDVLVGDAPPDQEHGQQVLRVRDGKLLGRLPYHNCGRGALMAIVGNQVTWTSASDTGGGPSCSYRLKLAGADAIAAERVFVLGEDDKKARIFYNQHDFPTVAGKAWLYRSQLFDAATGALLAKLPASVENCAVVAGHHLIALADAGWGNDPGGRPRDDRKAMCRFVVFDIQAPTRPKLVGQNNLLGYAGPPADLIVKGYLSEFDPYDLAGCYKGSQSFFAMMSGPVPQGSRLYIQSSAYLYCIGEK